MDLHPYRPDPRAAGDETVPTSVGSLSAWTAREQAVAAYLRQGQSNKEIAHKLEILESTVKVYVRQVMRKLGASNRTQAALLLAVPSSPKAVNGHSFLARPSGESGIGL